VVIISYYFYFLEEINYDIEKWSNPYLEIKGLKGIVLKIDGIIGCSKG